MATQTKAASSCQQVDTGNSDWSDFANITAEDGAFVSCTGVAGSTAQSNALRVNFGFEIPAGSTINGFSAIAIGGGTASDGGTFPHTLGWRLVTDSKTGRSKAGDPGSWEATDEAHTVGGASDNWGDTWTVAQVNDPTFSLQISWSIPGGTAQAAIVRFDYAELTVHYTPPPSAPGPRRASISIGIPL